MLEYLWKITICAIVYGVITILAGDGPGADITKIACACGMLIVIMGSQVDLNQMQWQWDSTVSSLEERAAEGERLMTDKMKTEAEEISTEKQP